MPEGALLRHRRRASSGSVRATASACWRRSAPIVPGRCWLLPEVNRQGRRAARPSLSAKARSASCSATFHATPRRRRRPRGVRLSLGGVQDKLILIRLPGGDFAQPLGGMPSNCLLKPEHERFEGLAVQRGVLHAGRGGGREHGRDVRVARVRRHSLLVQRALRPHRRRRGATVRLHQEDMCQALGLLPTPIRSLGTDHRWRSIFALLR